MTVDDVVLLTANAIGLAAVVALVAIKVYMRLWRDPDERSILVLVVGLLGLLGIALGTRFGMPDETRFLLLKFAFPAVTVAAAYRFKVHLDALRDGSAITRGDPESILVVVAELRRLMHEIERLEPCPTPACMDMRSKLLTSIARLPDQRDLAKVVRQVVEHHHQHTKGGTA